MARFSYKMLSSEFQFLEMRLWFSAPFQTLWRKTAVIWLTCSVGEYFQGTGTYVLVGHRPLVNSQEQEKH